MEQLTKEQAIALAETKWWENCTDEEIVRFQFFQDKLCMDFGEFHRAVEAVAGRPVWTHEFAFKDRLIEELYGDKPKPTLEEIMNLIPEDKRIIIGL